MRKEFFIFIGIERIFEGQLQEQVSYFCGVGTINFSRNAINRGFELGGSVFLEGGERSEWKGKGSFGEKSL